MDVLNYDICLLYTSRDYKVQGMVWEYIGYLNSVQGLYENSIDNFKHSIRYYELASDMVVAVMPSRCATAISFLTDSSTSSPQTIST